MPAVLAFDVGIRNLAYCLIAQGEGEGGGGSAGFAVKAWGSVDLQAGGVASGDARRCGGCGKPAAFADAALTPPALWCKGCTRATKRRPAAAPKPPLPCATTVRPLRALAAAEGLTVAGGAGAKRDALLAAAATRYLLPYKPPRANREPLAGLCAALDAWLDGVLPLFATADGVRLENQPALTGPTMKSVQIMVFTLLLHRLRREHAWGGDVTFVHAKEKTRAAAGSTAAAPAPGSSTGTSGAAVAPSDAKADAKTAAAAKSAAKRERKGQAIALVEEALARPGVAVPAALVAAWRAAKKQDDLADAFLMAARPWP